MVFEALRSDLDALQARGRLRRLGGVAGRDFASNDYLALAGSARLADAVRRALDDGVPVGSGGSRLLRGDRAAFATLEAQAAAFFECEAALYFGSGYAANVALFQALPRDGDLVVHDALVHASAHEGMRLGRAARREATHNDADAFADAIAAWRREGGTGTPWIAVESLYSMDGDRAPLAALAEVAARHDAVLLIDEAHAVGVWGRDGRGLADALDGAANVVTLKTCGKALGAEGALVCGPAVVRDTLVTRARGFIFSTAPSPLMAAAVSEALRALVDEPDRRARLHALAAHAGRRLGVATGTQIVPIVIGDDAATMRVAAGLQAAGFDVRGIRPPTVPTGTSRLRIALTLHADTGAVDALAGVLEELL